MRGDSVDSTSTMSSEYALLGDVCTVLLTVYTGKGGVLVLSRNSSQTDRGIILSRGGLFYTLYIHI